MSLPLFDVLQPSENNDVISDALEAVRLHLDMEFSYLSEFSGDDIVFRAVSHTNDLAIVAPGDHMKQELTYCARVASGALPQLIQDTNDHPLTQSIAVTKDIPIRAHISVPIRRRDGRIHGMFCCFSRKPNPSLNQRDLDIVTMFAGLAASSLNKQLEKTEAIDNARNEITGLIDEGGFETYLQPIVSLRDGRAMAVEALTRFKKDRQRGPLWWFNKATQADMQVTLETEAIRSAITLLPNLARPAYLTVNASPETIASDPFMAALRNVPPNRLIIELTEHEEIAETTALMNVVAELRRRKIGIAIDDVGAGYSGLSTILRLNPNVLKLDRSLVDGVHADRAKQSLTSALLEFANKMGAFLIAEGVEQEADDRKLRELGTRLGQGYLYARPAPAQHELARLKNHAAIKSKAS